MVADWQKCDDHGGFGFKSDCVVCNGIDSDIIEQVATELMGHCFMPPDHDDIPSCIEKAVALQVAQQIDQLYKKRLVEIVCSIKPRKWELINGKRVDMIELHKLSKAIEQEL